MPELPEVETIVRELLELKVVNLKVKNAVVYWDRTIASLSPDAFCNRIANQTILNVSRRGKFIVFTLTKDTLFVHLRMTGKFLIENSEVEPTSHERVRLYLNDKTILRYEDQRKFGKWYLVDNPETFMEKIGLEPLSKEFTFNNFCKILEKGSRKIKPFLLDQQHIAGLGNIYVDEALWASQIHPARAVNELSQKEKIKLHQAIINVLTAGVENTGTSLGSTRANYYSVSGRRGGNQQSLKVFRRDGLPCPRCGTLIQKIVLAQRGTHLCPHCQQL